MRTIRINLKEEDIYLLKFIFPEMEVNVSSDVSVITNPMYLSVVRSNILVLLSSSGINVYNSAGLVAFLREAQVMSEGKLRRVDNRDDLSLVDRFRNASLLLVANMGTGREDEDKYLTDGLFLPFCNRFIFFEGMPPGVFIRSVLRFIVKMFSPDAMRGYGQRYKEKISELRSRFNKRDFKKFNLSKDLEISKYELMLLWR